MVDLLGFVGSMLMLIYDNMVPFLLLFGAFVVSAMTVRDARKRKRVKLQTPATKGLAPDDQANNGTERPDTIRKPAFDLGEDGKTIQLEVRKAIHDKIAARDFEVEIRNMDEIVNEGAAPSVKIHFGGKTPETPEKPTVRAPTAADVSEGSD